MRLFVAVEVSQAVRDAIAALLPELEATAAHSRFVKPEKMHLTLQFLGSVDPTRVEAIGSALQTAAAGQGTVSLSFKAGGSFGSARSPRVLWVGVEGEVPKLIALQQRIAKHLEPLGFPPETRPYSPHLTLARARNVRGDRQLRACVEKLATFSVPGEQVSRVVLMESVQDSAGGRYRVVEAVQL